MYTEHELALGRVQYETMWSPYPDAPHPDWEVLDSKNRDAQTRNALVVAKHVLQSPTVWKIRLGVRTPTPAEQVAASADRLREAAADQQVSTNLSPASETKAYGHSLEERLYTARRLEEQRG